MSIIAENAAEVVVIVGRHMQRAAHMMIVEIIRSTLLWVYNFQDLL